MKKKKKMSSKSAPNIKKLQEEVDHVVKTVYHGNGKPSVLTQLSSLDERMKNLDDNFNNKINSLEKEMELKFTHIAEVVTEKFNNISAQITREFDTKKSEHTSVWNFKTAITTTALASVTSVFVILLSELMKRIH